MRAGVRKFKCEARAMRAKGACLKDIAEHFGVHENTVRRWCADVKPRFETRQCANEKCRAAFTPTHIRQVTCSVACQRIRRFPGRRHYID